MNEAALATYVHRAAAATDLYTAAAADFFTAAAADLYTAAAVADLFTAAAADLYTALTVRRWHCHLPEQPLTPLISEGRRLRRRSPRGDAAVPQVGAVSTQCWTDRIYIR